MAATPGPTTPTAPPATPGSPGVRALALGVLLAPALGVVAAAAAWSALLPLPAAAVVPTTLACVAVGFMAAATLTRLLLKRLHAQRLIDEALASWSDGEPDPDALTITATHAGRVDAWNRLVVELTQRPAGSEPLGRADATPVATPAAADPSGVLNLLPFGVLVVNAEGLVVTANGAAGRMLRRGRDRLLDAPIHKLIDAEAFTALWSKSQEPAGRRGGHAEFTLHPGDEQQATARVTVRPMAPTDRSDTLVLLEDMTQQRAADRSRHLFVAQATHELRTPLTNIGLYVERAIDLAEDDAADRAECLNVINDEVLRLNRLVGEVLSVSEIEAGSLSIRRDDVKLDPLIDDLRETFTRQAQKKEITLDFDLPPKLPTLQGDRDKIALALHNLLGNAIKYTPAGGEVTVTAAEAGGSIELSVTDTGIGIGADDLPRVFDKFYRANDERLVGTEGSGLGLALAREVIRLHQGDITVESTLNEGSTFTLTLPVEACIK